MRNSFPFVLLLMSAIGISSCLPAKGHVPAPLLATEEPEHCSAQPVGLSETFDRIEPTENGRYGIAYREDKCGVYDYRADSLVTELKYDALLYGQCVTEDGAEFTVWVIEADGESGMLSVIGESNETVEIIFPKAE